MTEPIETPMAGIVRERPARHVDRDAGHRAGLPGIVTLGGPTRGRLHVAADRMASCARAAWTSAWPARSSWSARGSMPRP